MVSETVEALIAELEFLPTYVLGTKNGDPIDLADFTRKRIAKALTDAKDALELSLSPTPTGDEREVLEDILDDDLNWDVGEVFPVLLVEKVIDAILAAGFRVTPEPIYEYRCKLSSIDPSVEHPWVTVSEDHVCGGARERRVKAGPWFPVVSTSKEQNENE